MDKPHKKLNVWKLSMHLAGASYQLTAAFPAKERFGLASQMRRASVSVPSNLAEGAARNSKKEFRQFLSVARGSLSELDTQLDLCAKLNLITAQARNDLDRLLLQVDKMLYGLFEKAGKKGRE